MCRKPKPVEENCCSVANPIYVGRGFKVQTERDYQGPLGLAFVRKYASWHFSPLGSSFGGWFIDVYGRSLAVSSNFIVATRAPGETQAFDLQSTSWLARSTTTDVLEAFSDGQGSAWRYLSARTGTYEFYDANGRLLRVQPRRGGSHRLVYSDASTPIAIAPSAGLLIRVESERGAALQLQYDASGKLVSMQDPAGNSYTYAYGNGTDAPLGQLKSVTYPGGAQRAYHYEASLGPAAHYDLALSPSSVTSTELNTYAGTIAGISGSAIDVAYSPVGHLRNYAFLSSENHQFPLTGITDETGQRFATWRYDASGRPISSEHAGGAERVTVSYTGDVAQLTNVFGATTSLSFTTQSHRRQLSAISGAANTSLAGRYKAQTTNHDGTIASRTNWNNVVTSYTYDSSRLETSRVEAQNTAKARTITTQWDTTLRVPTQISEQGRRTTQSYDPAGNLLSRNVLDTATNASRTWTYTYNSYGQVLTADGPRTDVSDAITYAYYSCYTGYECGQVQTVTDARGRVTTYQTYNAHGQPLTIQEPNGLVSTLTYDLRQRLTSRTIGTEQTSFEYWPTGLLKNVTLPDGSAYSYTYDAAHRLIAIDNSLGERIEYTLDLAGNRIKEEVKAADGSVVLRRGQQFNALNQLQQALNAANEPIVSYAYDANGDPTRSTQHSESGEASSQYEYDALNRLTKMTDALQGVTDLAYDSNDQLIQVTDPKRLSTIYAVDGFANRLQTTSPDSGLLSNTYDQAGNVLSSSNARGHKTSYDYDPLDRVTRITYHDRTRADFVYDDKSNGNFGMGHLTLLKDSSGNTSYRYDQHGRLLNKTQTQPGSKLSTRYGYDSVGRLASQTLPSGRVVGYRYNHAGQVEALSINGRDEIHSLRYQPFGGVQSWRWRDGTAQTRSFDLDGRLTSYALGGQSVVLSYDRAGRLLQQSSALDKQYQYDPLVRVLGSSGGIEQLFTYDANGNRESLTQNGVSSQYDNDSTSNRILGINAVNSRRYSYDAAGNTLSDGLRSYEYNIANRLSRVSRGSVVVDNHYNGFGQRVRKLVSGSESRDVRYAYDEAGRTIGEYNANGSLISEIVYLGDMPVLLIKPEGVFNIQTDHLNTPRAITNDAQRIVWQWDSDAFGATAANDDPDRDGVALNFNLRFPGQLYDTETGLHYNYFRDYDPETGRYLQSDPIGLEGGINTYAYVGGNPVNYVDPLGLEIDYPGRPRHEPIGLPNPSAEAARQAAQSAADAIDEYLRREREKTYQTYTRYNPRTGQCYSGRTSGYDDPRINLKKRAAGQPLLNAEGFLPPVLDRSSRNKAAIRGREQQLIEANGGAQSMGGDSRNKINGISDWNFRKDYYIEEANKEFGSITETSNICECR